MKPSQEDPVSEEDVPSKPSGNNSTSKRSREKIPVEEEVAEVPKKKRKDRSQGQPEV